LDGATGKGDVRPDPTLTNAIAAHPATSGVVVFLVLFIILIIVAGVVAVFAALFVIIFLVLFVVIVQIFRDDVQMDGMRLRDFHLGFALGAAEDLAFFDFVFVHVDFGGTFGAADHVCILRESDSRVGSAGIASITAGQLLYTAVCDVNRNACSLLLQR
jgi:hypothetical protein